MSFTIQDMMTISSTRYQMKMLAGKNGWSNSISWVMMIEDTTILKNFTGKELVVTLGVGFPDDDALMKLVTQLVERHASGLIINTGGYIEQVPEAVIRYCDAFDLPLFEVPWIFHMSDMIKDLSIRIFMQDAADEQIVNALITAIEEPDNKEKYYKELLPYYNVEGKFQMVLFSTDTLKEMDSVERRKLSHQLQIYLENITHNGKFFYYDGCFMLMVNDVDSKSFDSIVDGMLQRAKRRAPELSLYVGVGSLVSGIEHLSVSYHRGVAAVMSAMQKGKDRENFDQMGIDRLLYSLRDPLLLEEMGYRKLLPLIEYDEKHHGEYVKTLASYIRHNGSIQAVAEEMMTHRNTIVYRIANIKSLIGCELATFEEREMYDLSLRMLVITK